MLWLRGWRSIHLLLNGADKHEIHVRQGTWASASGSWKASSPDWLPQQVWKSCQQASRQSKRFQVRGWQAFCLSIPFDIANWISIGWSVGQFFSNTIPKKNFSSCFWVYFLSFYLLLLSWWIWNLVSLSNRMRWFCLWSSAKRQSFGNEKSKSPKSLVNAFAWIWSDWWK